MDSFPSRDDLKRALEKADIAWGEVRTSKTILESPTVAARGVAAMVDDGAGGMRLVAQSPYRFSNADSGVRSGAPRRGQHNAAVLSEWIGSSAARIDELTKSQVLSAEKKDP
jgi:CoA:oxalate CoA-transferase